jgi:ABC-2 type transport system permease protein
MTATVYAPAAAPETLAPPPLARLVLVELRKAVDTRAGRWLLVLIVLVAMAGAILTGVTGSAGDRNLVHVLGATSQLVAVLLPVLGILLVTAEWSQRTALTTFTLVPRRDRVIAAKAAAGVLLAAAATIVCAIVSAAVLVTADLSRGGRWPDTALAGRLSLRAWLSCSSCGTWTTRWWLPTAWARGSTRWCSGRCSAGS